jgi:hypothetical protein
MCVYIPKKKERRTTKLMSPMKQQICLKKNRTKLCKKIIQEKKTVDQGHRTKRN